MTKIKKNGKKKKRPSVRLPVAPPTRAHLPKPEYRRRREKERLRREALDKELPEVATKGEEGGEGKEEGNGSA